MKYKIGDRLYPSDNLWDWGTIVKIDTRGFHMQWLPGSMWETKYPMPYSKWFLDKYYLVQPLQRIL